MKMTYPIAGKTILTISDQHMPYQHPDMIRFLAAIKKKYKPDLVVNIGDALDFHNMSFHPSDPDLANAGDELIAGRKVVKEMEKLFPKMIVVESNHGSLPLRKLVANGLTRHIMKAYNDIYDVGKGWQFVEDLTLTQKDQIIYFCHGISKNGKQLAAQRGVCVVEGHYHTEFRIDYISNPRNLLWSMQVGCLINKAALAFAYDKMNLNRPVIGTGIILSGVPRLLPMNLLPSGRWDGKLS